MPYLNRLIGKVLIALYSRTTFLASLATVLAFAAFFGMRNRLLANLLPPSWVGSVTPDGMWFYDKPFIELLHKGWGTEGQGWYVASQLVLDFAFPLFYGLFLAAIVVHCVSHAKLQIWLLRVVIIAIFFDWGENILNIAFIRVGAGSISASLVSVAACCTLAKWLLLITTFLTSIVFLGRKFVRSLLRPSSSKSTQDSLLTIGQRLKTRGLSLISHLVDLRFPILAIAALLWLGYAAVSSNSLGFVSANLMLLENYLQVFVLSCSNGLAVFFSVVIMRRIYALSMHEHSTTPTSSTKYRLPKWSPQLYFACGAISSVTPLAAFHYTCQQISNTVPPSWPQVGWVMNSVGKNAGRCLEYTLGGFVVLLGFFVAIGCMWLAARITEWAVGSSELSEKYFPFRRSGQQGIIRQTLFCHYDAQITVCLSLVFAFYWLLLPRFQLELSLFLSVPTLMVMLIWLVTMILSGMGVWFSKTRIPILTILVLYIILIRSFTPAHKLPVMRAGATQLTPIAASSGPTNTLHGNAILARISQHNTDRNTSTPAGDSSQPSAGKGKTLVVVTCPGGGIHAAAWAYHVLTQLDARYADFTNSIAVISAVSGGSVGAANFINDKYSNAGNYDTRQLAKSSLEAIAGGLVLNDLPGAFVPYFGGADRGLRLEWAWQADLTPNTNPAGDTQPPTDPTMNDWGNLAIQGDLPIVTFNAMDAISGRRVLFSTVPLPTRASVVNRSGAPLNFRALMGMEESHLVTSPAVDLRIATAVRASATFPYASPLAQLGELSSVAIGDGGYVDNEGIVTAIEWIEQIERLASPASAPPISEPNKRPFDRILLLRIHPTPDITGPYMPDAAPSNLKRASRAILGPLEGLLSMRTASQSERGQFETDLIDSRLNSSPTPGSPPDALENTNSEAASGSQGAENSDPQESLKSTPASQKRPRNLKDKIAYREIEDFVRHSKTPMQEQSASVDARRFNPSTPEDLVDQANPAIAASSDSQDGARLIVLTVPFQLPEGKHEMPLNWKLSPRELDIYDTAWESLVPRNTSALGHNDEESEAIFIQILDTLFHKATP